MLTSGNEFPTIGGVVGTNRRRTHYCAVGHLLSNPFLPFQAHLPSARAGSARVRDGCGLGATGAFPLPRRQCSQPCAKMVCGDRHLLAVILGGLGLLEVLPSCRRHVCRMRVVTTSCLGGISASVGVDVFLTATAAAALAPFLRLRACSFGAVRIAVGLGSFCSRFRRNLWPRKGGQPGHEIFCGRCLLNRLLSGPGIGTLGGRRLNRRLLLRPGGKIFAGRSLRRHLLRHSGLRCG
mmetsp:Transcript_67793/g.189228  ORF Transcript_67793/g.189228 Transcript_67793/m.189228 type:complete len:237 (-) Transcript_67793:242-952(-)